MIDHDKDIFWFEDRYILESKSGCWVWVGKRNGGREEKYKYGAFRDINNKTVMVHRALYEQEHGAIPEDLELEHLCKNASCVNPQHLEAVIHKTIQVRRFKNRTHCKNGHKYTTRRICLICRSAAERRRYRARKQNATN